MFSLFVSFDMLISYLNQTLFCFFLITVFTIFFSNYLMFVNNLFFKLICYLVGELFLTSKIKSSFNLNFFMILTFFVLFTNLLGMFPYLFTLSSQLNFCFFLSFIFWFMVIMNNFFFNYIYFVPHLVPTGSPIVLSQFMVLIETISQLIRPLTLSVRLMANMTAGHLIMILTSSPIFVFSLVSLPLFLLLFLEFMVAFIQAYVFTILLTMYLGEFNN